MSCLFCTGGSHHHQRRRRQRLLLEEVVANGNATIQRDMEDYNKRLQQCLIAKASQKQTPKQQPYVDVESMIPDTPCVATRVQCQISSRSYHDDGDDDESSPAQVVYTGWLEFACGKAAQHQDNNDTTKPARSAITCDGRDHVITGSFQSVSSRQTNGGRAMEENDGVKIVQGKWCPSGFCYWVEQHPQQQQTVFIVHDLGESKTVQTATIFAHNATSGTKQRHTRSMEMTIDPTKPQPAQCPSVATVFNMKL